MANYKSLNPDYEVVDIKDDNQLPQSANNDYEILNVTDAPAQQTAMPTMSLLDALKSKKGLSDALNKNIAARGNQLLGAPGSEKENMQQALSAFARGVPREFLQGGLNIGSLLGAVPKEISDAPWPSAIAEQPADAQHPVAKILASAAGLAAPFGAEMKALDLIPGVEKLSAAAAKRLVTRYPVNAAKMAVAGYGVANPGERPLAAVQSAVFGPALAELIRSPQSAKEISDIFKNWKNETNLSPQISEVEKAGIPLAEQKEGQESQLNEAQQRLFSAEAKQAAGEKHKTNEEKFRDLSQEAQETTGKGNPQALKTAVESNKDKIAKQNNMLAQYEELKAPEQPQYPNAPQEPAELQAPEGEVQQPNILPTDFLEEATNNHEQAQQHLAATTEDLQNFLGKGQAHAERAGKIVKQVGEAKEAELKAGYDKFDKSLEDESITLTNPEEAKLAFSEAKAASQDVAPEAEISKSEELPRQIPALQYMRAWRNVRDIGANLWKDSSNWNLPYGERMKLAEKASKYESTAKKMRQALEEGLPEDKKAEFKRLTEEYRKEVIPRRQNPSYNQAQTHELLSENIINELRGTEPGDALIKRDILANPEANKAALGQVFAEKPELLHEYNERAEPYIESMPGLKEKMAAHRTAMSNATQAKANLERARAAASDIESRNKVSQAAYNKEKAARDKLLADIEKKNNVAKGTYQKQIDSFEKEKLKIDEDYQKAVTKYEKGLKAKEQIQSEITKLQQETDAKEKALERMKPLVQEKRISLKEKMSLEKEYRQVQREVKDLKSKLSITNGKMRMNDIELKKLNQLQKEAKDKNAPFYKKVKYALYGIAGLAGISKTAKWFQRLTGDNEE